MSGSCVNPQGPNSAPVTSILPGGAPSLPSAMTAFAAPHGGVGTHPVPSPLSALGGAPTAALSAAGLSTAARLSAVLHTAIAPPVQNMSALTRRARRLHVGNLPVGVGLTAEMLKQFFNAAMVSASLHDTSMAGDPVMDAMLGSEGKFGFVEFRTIAEATSCMALNNIELGGKQLRVERPRDYAPMPESMHDELRKVGYLGTTSLAPDGKDLLAAQPAAPTTSASLHSLANPSIAVPAVPPLDTSSPTP